jgi:hypothetical protein
MCSLSVNWFSLLYWVGPLSVVVECAESVWDAQCDLRLFKLCYECFSFMSLMCGSIAMCLWRAGCVHSLQQLN